MLLTHATWKKRGWCRVERAARWLSRGDSRLVVVTSENYLTVANASDSLFDHPGTGEFAIDEDREVVAQIMQEMVEAKLATLFASRRFSDYRILCALRRAMFEGHVNDCRGSVHLLPIDEGLPPAERFLQELGMRGPQEQDDAGRTALHYAAAAGDAEVATGLLAMRGEVDARTTKKDAPHCFRGRGFTPLHCAARFATRTEVLDVLLDARACIDARTDRGETPLHACSNAGRVAVLELLVERRAALEARNVSGGTPLLAAALHGREALVRYLVRADADAKATSHFGTNALHCVALFSGAAELVAPLAQAGCPVDGQLISLFAATRRTPNRGARVGLTVLSGSVSVAYGCGSRAPAVVVFSHMEGITPLMCAALLGRGDVARALRAQGASATLTSRNGFTAADWARLTAQPADFMAELYGRQLLHKNI